jgi:hypothetical protein
METVPVFRFCSRSPGEGTKGGFMFQFSPAPGEALEQVGYVYPPLKRRAIFGRPYGTKKHGMKYVAGDLE